MYARARVCFHSPAAVLASSAAVLNRILRAVAALVAPAWRGDGWRYRRGLRPDQGKLNRPLEMEVLLAAWSAVAGIVASLSAATRLSATSGEWSEVEGS